VTEHALHAAIEALALENARLRATVAFYEAHERQLPRRAYHALVGGDYLPDGEPSVDAILARAYLDDVGGADA
jgi:hypothetical protein